MKSSSGSKSKGIWVWIALLAVGGSAFGAWKAGWIGASEKKELLGATVKRETLVISVVQRGNLASKDALSVKSEIEGQATILSLIPEGTIVKPGDLLVELEMSELRDKRVAQDISVQNAEASFVKAKAQFEIQESQNKSDIEAADRKLLFAQKDREKYLKGDLAQQLAAAQEKIKLAEAEQAKAQNTFNWSNNLAEKGFLTKTELERDELDFQRAEVQLVQAQRALVLLNDYDDPRKKIELDANVQEAERGVERAKLQAESRLADFQSSLLTSESKLKLEKEKLEKIEDQLKKGRITAAQGGMVVYARVESGRMGNSDPIAVGTQVRERQEIISIPRTTGIIVEASVHESVLQQVAVGKPCKISVEALKNQEFAGRVTYVAPLADKGSWWANPNQRLYRTEIQVLEPDLEMRPGMSCNIEILSEVVNDALVVPLQSIFLDGDSTIAFVVEGQRSVPRPVKTGRSSQTLVEVVEGLKEGETVLLAPPAGFAPKASKDREQDLSTFPPALAPDAAAPPGAGANRGMPNGAAVMPGGGGGEGGARPGMGGANGGGERRGRPDGAPRGERGGGRDRSGGGAGAGGAGGGATADGTNGASGDAKPDEKKAEAAPSGSGGGAR